MCSCRLYAVTYEVKHTDLPPYSVGAISDTGALYGCVSGTTQLLIWDAGTGVNRSVDIGQTLFYVQDVNKYDQVLLGTDTSSFLWKDNEPLISVPAVAKKVNSLGQVLYQTPVGGSPHTFFWDSMLGSIDLGIPAFRDYAYGLSLNDQGTIAGRTVSGNYSLGFIWTRSEGLQDLPLPFSYDSSFVVDINNQGDIAGYYQRKSDSSTRGFVKDSSGYYDLGQSSQAIALSDNGYVLFFDNSEGGAYVWDRVNGKVKLPLLAGYTGVRPSFMNNRGDVFGYCIGPNWNDKAAVYWTRTLPIPTKPVVWDSGNYSDNLNALEAHWMSTVAETTITEYQYALGESQNDPGTGYTVGWTSSGLQDSATLTGLNLVPGHKYFVYVKARNGQGNWSVVGVSDGIVVVNKKAGTPGDAKLAPDAAVVSIENLVLLEYAGNYYVQDVNRSSGLRVTGSVPSHGDTLNLSGVLSTNADGERSVQIIGYEKTGSGFAAIPLTVSAKAAASRPFFFNSITGAGQRGVNDPSPYGASTVGLYVRVSGTVTDIDANFVYLNDGSSSNATGIRVAGTTRPGSVSIGRFINVDGVSSLRRSGSVYQLLIRPRSSSDWTVAN